MIPILLYLLATIDAACCGYRDAAARSALIRKEAYYRRALLRGAIFGQAAIVVAGALILVFIILSSDRALLINDLNEAGRRMLLVYLPYAIIIVVAFGLRLIPSVDLRSITSLLIFGPFIFIRPFIAVAGLAWAVIAVPRVEILLLGLLVLLLMLSLEPFLGWLRAYRERSNSQD
jgi:hypothetical protein